MSAVPLEQVLLHILVRLFLSWLLQLYWLPTFTGAAPQQSASKTVYAQGEAKTTLVNSGPLFKMFISTWMILPNVSRKHLNCSPPIHQWEQQCKAINYPSGTQIYPAPTTTFSYLTLRRKKNNPGTVLMFNSSCIYLGCVKDPCSTKAAWEMHCDRMLLSNWLTVGWLHI